MYVVRHKDSFTSTNMIHSYNTWQNMNMYVIPQNYANFRKSVYVNCTKLYNKVPTRFRDVTNSRTFRKDLLQLLLGKSYYSVDLYLNDKIL